MMKLKSLLVEPFRLTSQQISFTMTLIEYEARRQFWGLDYLEEELFKDMVDKTTRS